MKKLLQIAAVILIGVAVAGCLEFGRQGKKEVSLDTACEVSWKLFYAEGGRFTLTGPEYDGLRVVNQNKVTRFKFWFKTECPVQYARTVGGKAKK